MNEPKPAKIVKDDKAKERKPSMTYAIDQLKAAVMKAEVTKIATDEEIKRLKEIYHTILKRWIGGKLEF